MRFPYGTEFFSKLHTHFPNADFRYGDIGSLPSEVCQISSLKDTADLINKLKEKPLLVLLVDHYEELRVDRHDSFSYGTVRRFYYHARFQECCLKKLADSKTRWSRKATRLKRRTIYGY
jgi:hypothetical protein